MNPTDRYDICPNTLVRQVGDEIVILELTNGQYYGLDALGARILGFLQQDSTIEEVCAFITEDYAVDCATVRKDVGRLIDDLVSRKVLNIRPNS